MALRAIFGLRWIFCCGWCLVVALEGGGEALLDNLGALENAQPILLHVADMGEAANMHDEALPLADHALLEGGLLCSYCRASAAYGGALARRSRSSLVRGVSLCLLGRLVGLPRGGSLLGGLATAGFLLLRGELGELGLGDLGVATGLGGLGGRGLGGVLGLVVLHVGLEALSELVVRGERSLLRHLARLLQLAEDDDGDGARELLLASGGELGVLGVPQGGQDRRGLLGGGSPPGATTPRAPCCAALCGPLAGGLTEEVLQEVLEEAPLVGSLERLHHLQRSIVGHRGSHDNGGGGMELEVE